MTNVELSRRMARARLGAATQRAGDRFLRTEPQHLRQLDFDAPALLPCKWGAVWDGVILVLCVVGAVTVILSGWLA